MALRRPDTYTSVLLALLYILASTVHANECPNKTFPCFNDCCLRGEWFCHDKEERCKQCSHWDQLCGTDREPVECMLYCHNLGQQHQTCVKENPLLSVIVVTVTAIVIAISSSILTICLKNVWLFKKADQFCVRLLKAVSGKIVHETTETDDVDVKDGLLNSDQATSGSDSPLAPDVTGSNETIRLKQERELRLNRRDTEAVIDVPETVVVHETPEQAPTTTEQIVSLSQGESSQAPTLDSVTEPPSSAPEENRPTTSDSVTFGSSTQQQIHEHQGEHSRSYTAALTRRPAQPLWLSSVPATPDNAQHQRTIHTGTSGPLREGIFVLDLEKTPHSDNETAARLGAEEK